MTNITPKTAIAQFIVATDGAGLVGKKKNTVVTAQYTRLTTFSVEPHLPQSERGSRGEVIAAHDEQQDANGDTVGDGQGDSADAENSLENRIGEQIQHAHEGHQRSLGPQRSHRGFPVAINMSQIATPRQPAITSKPPRSAGTPWSGYSCPGLDR